MYLRHAAAHRVMSLPKNWITTPTPSCIMFLNRGCLVVFTMFCNAQPSYKQFLTGGGLILGVVVFPSNADTLIVKETVEWKSAPGNY